MLVAAFVWGFESHSFAVYPGGVLLREQSSLEGEGKRGRGGRGEQTAASRICVSVLRLNSKSVKLPMVCRWHVVCSEAELHNLQLIVCDRAESRPVSMSVATRPVACACAKHLANFMCVQCILIGLRSSVPRTHGLPTQTRAMHAV